MDITKSTDTTIHDILEDIKPNTVCCFNCVHCSSNREKYFYPKIQRLAKLYLDRIALEKSIPEYNQLSWWKRLHTKKPNNEVYAFGDLWRSDLMLINEIISNNHTLYTCCLAPTKLTIQINYDCSNFKCCRSQNYYIDESTTDKFYNLADYMAYLIQAEINAK